MKNKIIVAFIGSCMFSLFLGCNAQSSENKYDPNGIHWMSFEEAVKKNDANPKRIFIDTYTEWCGWCKKMDASTFKDPAVIKYMNDNFYAVKLDAETKDTISFHDKKFGYVAEYKTNQIAIDLMQGQMSYPTYTFLDGQYQLIYNAKGYQTVDQFLPELHYFAEEQYKNNIKLEDYISKQTSGNQK
ncbi:MAG: thioredoxin family protein [Bacteroidota bacterium]